MLRIVAAEVVDECRYLTLELDVKWLDDIEPTAFWLSGYNPVDVCIVVHTDANGRIRVNVGIGTAVNRSRVEVVAEGVKIGEIRGIVLVRLFHRRIKTVLGNSDPLT